MLQKHVISFKKYFWKFHIAVHNGRFVHNFAGGSRSGTHPGHSINRFVAPKTGDVNPQFMFAK